MEKKFESGQLLFTNGVSIKVRDDLSFKRFVLKSLKRHEVCDFGDLEKQDIEQNVYAVKNQGRIFSAYKFNDSEKIWIITNADRSSSCVLFPSEY